MGILIVILLDYLHISNYNCCHYLSHFVILQFEDDVCDTIELPLVRL